MVARNTREQVRRVDTPAATPLLITDGALVTADAVWAWVQVPIASTFLAEEDDLDQATVATARALAMVLPPGVDYHLKVLPAPHTGAAYRAVLGRVRQCPLPRRRGLHRPRRAPHRPERGDRPATAARSCCSGSVAPKTDPELHHDHQRQGSSPG